MGIRHSATHRLTFARAAIALFCGFALAACQNTPAPVVGFPTPDGTVAKTPTVYGSTLKSFGAGKLFNVDDIWRSQLPYSPAGYVQIAPSDFGNQSSNIRFEEDGVLLTDTNRSDQVGTSLPDQLVMLDGTNGSMRWQRQIPAAVPTWERRGRFIGYLDTRDKGYKIATPQAGNVLHSLPSNYYYSGDTAKWSTNSEGLLAVRTEAWKVTVYDISETAAKPVGTVDSDGIFEFVRDELYTIRNGALIAAKVNRTSQTTTLSTRTLVANLGMRAPFIRFEADAIGTVVPILIKDSNRLSRLYNAETGAVIELPPLEVGDVLEDIYINRSNVSNEDRMLIRTFKRGNGVYYAQIVTRSLDAPNTLTALTAHALNPNLEFTRIAGAIYGGYRFAFYTNDGRFGIPRGLALTTPASVTLTAMPCITGSSDVSMLSNYGYVFVVNNRAPFGFSSIDAQPVACAPAGLRAVTGQMAAISVYTEEGEDPIRYVVHPRTEQDQVGNTYGSSAQPGGRLVASAGLDKLVRVWDRVTGRRIATIRGHTDAVYAVAWNPTGTRLASAGSDGRILVWNMTGRVPALEQTLSGHTYTVRALAWSPDGNRLASASWDGTARVWDSLTGQGVFEFRHNGYVNDVRFSPDGTTIATASSDRTVRLWNAASGVLTRTFSQSIDSVFSLAWSPNGSSLATGGGDKTVRVYDTASGALRTVLNGHRGAIRALSWLPDNVTLLSGGMDGALIAWDAVQTRLIFEAQAQKGFAVFGLEAIGENEIYGSTADGSLTQFKLDYIRTPWRDILPYVGLPNDTDVRARLFARRSDEEVQAYPNIYTGNTASAETYSGTFEVLKADRTTVLSSSGFSIVLNPNVATGGFAGATVFEANPICVRITVNGTIYGPVCEQ